MRLNRVVTNLLHCAPGCTQQNRLWNNRAVTFIALQFLCLYYQLSPQQTKQKSDLKNCFCFWFFTQKIFSKNVFTWLSEMWLSLRPCSKKVLGLISGWGRTFLCGVCMFSCSSFPPSERSCQLYLLSVRLVEVQAKIWSRSPGAAL